MAKRGRPRKQKSPPFQGFNSPPSFALDSYGPPVKKGKTRGWKAALDYDYSACDPATRNICAPEGIEGALREWQSDNLLNSFQKAAAKGEDGRKAANDARHKQKEGELKYLLKTYSDKIGEKRFSNKRCAELIQKDEIADNRGLRNRSVRTLRQDVGEIRKKVGMA